MKANYNLIKYVSIFVSVYNTLAMALELGCSEGPHLTILITCQCKLVSRHVPCQCDMCYLNIKLARKVIIHCGADSLHFQFPYCCVKIRGSNIWERLELLANGNPNTLSHTSLDNTIMKTPNLQSPPFQMQNLFLKPL